MKITSNLINPMVGFSIKIWHDDDMMRMFVTGATEPVLFRPGEGVEITICGQGNQPVEIATYREPPSL